MRLRTGIIWSLVSSMIVSKRGSWFLRTHLQNFFLINIGFLLRYLLVLFMVVGVLANNYNPIETVAGSSITGLIYNILSLMLIYIKIIKSFFIYFSFISLNISLKFFSSYLSFYLLLFLVVETIKHHKY